VFRNAIGRTLRFFATAIIFNFKNHGAKIFGFDFVAWPKRVIFPLCWPLIWPLTWPVDAPWSKIKETRKNCCYNWTRWLVSAIFQIFRLTFGQVNHSYTAMLSGHKPENTHFWDLPTVWNLEMQNIFLHGWKNGKSNTIQAGEKEADTKK